MGWMKDAWSCSKRAGFWWDHPSPSENAFQCWPAPPSEKQPQGGAPETFAPPVRSLSPCFTRLDPFKIVSPDLTPFKINSRPSQLPSTNWQGLKIVCPPVSGSLNFVSFLPELLHVLLQYHRHVSVQANSGGLKKAKYKKMYEAKKRCSLNFGWEQIIVGSAKNFTQSTGVCYT